MAPNFSTYFSFSDFNGGTPASYEQFRSELSRFNGPTVIYLCGVVNSVITDWQGNYHRDAHEELVKNSFAAGFAERIIAEGRRPANPRSVYHRRQLMFVAKEAILCCPDRGGIDPLTPPHSGEIGRVLLMANDLLPKRLAHGGPTLLTPDQMIKVMSELIPVGETSGHFKAINKIVRSRLMLDRFLPGRGTDVRRVFEEETGIPLDQYFALCFATLCRYSELNLKKYQADPGTYVLLENWYKTLPISQAVLARFLLEISASSDEFRCLLRGQVAGSTDLTCFRNKPIFQDDNGRYLIDSLCLAEKGEAGVFWRVNNALPQESRLQFHRDWGTAFEKYVNWLIGESADPNINQIYPNPTFRGTGKEVCDALIVSGDSMLFVESKGATLSAKSKYGTDPVKLRDEIEEKFVQTKDAKKGIGQLALRIQEVFDRKGRKEIAGVDTSRIRKVYPILVTRDDIGSALLFNAYLASRFKDLFARKSVSVTVTPPHCLSAQDLEVICGYLRVVSLADLLEARYQNDRGLMSSFSLVDNPLLDKLGGRECKPLADAIHAYFREVAELLFPGAGVGSGA